MKIPFLGGKGPDIATADGMQETKAGDGLDWRWVFLMFGGNSCICEARIGALSKLPESFEIRRLTQTQQRPNPETVKAVQQIREEAETKLRIRSATASQHEMQRFQAKLIEEGNKKVAELPKLPPVTIPIPDAQTPNLSSTGWCNGGVAVVFELDPALAKRCSEVWAEWGASLPQPEEAVAVDAAREPTAEEQAQAVSKIASMAARKLPPGAVMGSSPAPAGEPSHLKLVK